MLRWSGEATGDGADLGAVASDDGEVGIEHGRALRDFATAASGRDPEQLDVARRRLVDETDEAFMVDAAAVAANFAMMTRLADGTGARFPESRKDEVEQIAQTFGIRDATPRG